MNLYNDDDYYTAMERLTTLQIKYEALRGDARCAARVLELQERPEVVQGIIDSILAAPVAWDICPLMAHATTKGSDEN